MNKMGLGKSCWKKKDSICERILHKRGRKGVRKAGLGQIRLLKLCRLVHKEDFGKAGSPVYLLRLQAGLGRADVTLQKTIKEGTWGGALGLRCNSLEWGQRGTQRRGIELLREKRMRAKGMGSGFRNGDSLGK